MNKIMLFMIVFVLCVVPVFSVLPVPEYKSDLIMSKGKGSEIFRFSRSGLSLPSKVLALRVEFSDIKFNVNPEGSDISHDKDYFERIMFHIKTFYSNASKNKYNFEYDVLDQVITLPKEMGYYGNDEKWDTRIVEFLRESIELADSYVNFNDYLYEYRGLKYAAVIIFHAGAGQESDVTGNNKDCLWSTFLTLSDIADVMAIDDTTDFHGILTNDDVYIPEVAICPESQKHVDYEENTTNYGVLGVVAHEFGHLLGLPTLFDNDSSNGRSAGIGNFGIMGTGSWNANGHVPPFPSAWSRYFLGWEDPVIINQNKKNNEIRFSSFNETEIPSLYRINVSEKEYFLIENRQQNPDKSILNGFPNFTFPLLPPGEQDYYPAPYDNVPRFNFMKNSYNGAEWDFFFPGPGYGDPPGENNKTVDGSGLFIWHIDENIIDDKMTSNLDVNSINGDSYHKGVDLEEADGENNLDSYIPNPYMFGGPYDSFRLGNNQYFGYENYYSEDGEIYYSYPTSAGYYGAPNFEIKNISKSDTIMTFDVSFDWFVDDSYSGVDSYQPFVYFEDNSEFIIYPHPNGVISGWKDGDILSEFPLNLQAEIIDYYTVDKKNNLWIPISKNNEIGIICINSMGKILKEEFFPDKEWISPIVISEQLSIFALYDEKRNQSTIYFIEDMNIEQNTVIQGKITSNIVIEDNIYFVSKNQNYEIIVIDKDNNIKKYLLEVDFKDKDIIYIAKYDNLYLKNEKSIYTVSFNDDVINVTNIFSFSNTVAEKFNFAKNSYMINNILLGDLNSFYVMNNFNDITTVNEDKSIPFSTDKKSISPLQINDKLIKVIGKRYLALWKDKNNLSDYTLVDSYPKILLDETFSLPVLIENSDFVYIGTNNGKVQRFKIEGYSRPEWYTDYGNLQRNAICIKNQNPIDKKFSFDKDRTYFYPNPYVSELHKGKNLNFIIGVNKTEDVSVDLYDISGSLVLSKKIRCYAQCLNKNKIKIPIENLSSGIYIAIISANGKKIERKIMVEK